MDFDLPYEIEELRRGVRRFVDEEVIPLESKLAGKPLDEEGKTVLQSKAAKLGLHLFDVPVAFGGQGLGMLARTIVWQEVARSTVLPSRDAHLFSPDVSPLLYLLNEEMREQYLKPVLTGKKRSCFAQTEPDAGSDPAAMKTTATRVDDGYVINGVKRFITGAERADFVQVFARTSVAEKGTKGISAFIVDMGAPGVKLGRQEELMVDDRPCEIVFTNVQIPERNRIGDEGRGFDLAQTWINSGRIRHGARSIGVIERCLELAGAYAKTRRTFGRPLSDRQLVKSMLVESHIDLHQLRLTVYDAAWRFDRGEDVRSQAFICKTFGDERSYRAADRAMQIFGGLGLSKEFPIERFFRDQRSMMITEGANEVLKMALADRVLADL